MSWTIPRTWVAGEDVTAALMNQHLRDNFAAIGDAWTAYTPAWTGAGGDPAIGNGTITGRYLQAGKLVMFVAEITVGSTTTFGSGTYSLSLPVDARAATRQPFPGTLYDASDSGTATYPIIGALTSTTAVDLWALPVTAGNTYRTVGPTNVITIATGDRITIAGTYEAA